MSAPVDSTGGWTPGPWEVDKRGLAGGTRFSGYVHSDDATGSAVALVRFDLVTRSEAETAANALLIATAPELVVAGAAIIAPVEAIIAEMVDHWGEEEGATPELSAALENLRAALAKARGQ